MASLSDKMTAGVNYSAFSKATDLHKRLWFTLLAIIVFRLGTYIPFPGINPAVLKEFLSDLSIAIWSAKSCFPKVTVYSVPSCHGSEGVKRMQSSFSHFQEP